MNSCKPWFLKLLAISLLFWVGLSGVFHQLLAQENQRQPAYLVNIQQANRAYQNGKYPEAIALWEKLLAQGKGDLTIIHNNLAIAYYQVGQFGAAIRNWEASIKTYREKGDSQSRQSLAKSLADQAQAYNALGRFQLAIPLAQEALQLAQEIAMPEVEAAALSFLGDSYTLAGDFSKAIEDYSESLRLATRFQSSLQVTQALSNLSRAYHKWSEFYARQAQMAYQEKEIAEEGRLKGLAEQKQEQALELAQQAVEAGQSVGGLPAVESLISLQQLDAQKSYSSEAIALLKSEPDSRSKAYALLNLAQWQQGEEKVQILLRATHVAQSLGDLHTQSLALGELGEYYEQAGDYNQALELTKKAQLAAAQVQALESLYRWQAQAGRLYFTQGNAEKAILNYRSAVNTLEEIRRSLAVTNREYQLDWREEVEPIYRQLIALLLEQGTPKAIKEALSVKELLQLAELEDFFKDECTQVIKTKTDSYKELLAQTQTASVHFFIAPQKTYTILQLPDGATQVHQVAVQAQRLQQVIEQWRFELEDTGTERYLPLSQQIYDWLMRPFESDLKAEGVKQLVFVGDGILRNVPMSALHDGQQFLVENYPSSIALGLNFIVQPPPRSRLSESLVFGLTNSPEGNLPNVSRETQLVANLLDGKRFLNEDFTAQNLNQHIEKSEGGVVHLATHGKFGGTVDRIFLETFEGKIFSQDLESILSRSPIPIQLLTLSACETATGNDRSVLGLAGVAIRSGVRSTLGSLWFLNDAATVPLITDFYQGWEDGLTKAEALQQAQVKQIKKYKNPVAVWSSFLLIGGGI